MAKSLSVSITVPTIAKYSVIILFTTLGSAVLISSTSFVTLYLGVELQMIDIVFNDRKIHRVSRWCLCS